MPEALTDRTEKRLIRSRLPESRSVPPDLRAQQVGSQVEAQRILGQQPGLSVHTHVVAVVFPLKPGDLHHVGCSTLDQVPELGLEVDVPGLVARGVGIGEIGSHQLLAQAQHVHVPFENAGNRVQHDSR